MTDIEDKYQEFLNLGFPDITGEQFFELTSLDSFSAGIIDTYITRKGKLSKLDFKLLVKLNLELKSAIKELNGVELTYFSFLSDLVNQIHSEIKKQQTN